ncbi:hypothetical protein [Aquabacterium sp.]|uniref:hypothetical protein n=1 Tax=Aquabacterium sp. TaxID=1872578 RepID=UPI0035AF3D4A
MKQSVRSWPVRILRAIWVGLIGLLLIFEEWGWEPLARLLALMGRLPGLRWIESRIRHLPPYAALGLFAIPVLSLLPIKLAALYWIGQGHAIIGLLIILAAKVGGTALTARLFMLTRDTLMQLPWFARWFQRWMDWKTRVIDAVKASAAWQQWQRLRSHIHQQWRSLHQWLRARF